MLYAFTSGAGNNGSAFAGINANTPWYNTTLGLAMLVGRFLMIVPALAIAGSLAGKKVVPPGPGTLPTNGPLFVVLLVGVILIVGALTFFPVALRSGPIVEHFLAPGRKGVLSHDATAQARLALRRPSLGRAPSDSLRKLDPAHDGQEPRHVRGRGRQRPHHAHLAARSRSIRPAPRPPGSRASVALWLWFTVLFANFAEAWPRAAGRPRPRRCAACARRRMARRLVETASEEQVPASQLRKGDVVVVEAGQMIPGDGEVIEGVASVDESAITGESAPVIRESGGDRSAVTGGTKVLSDRIVVRITADPGESFLDRMIGARRGRQAPEDAERDRAARPARRA